jgi:hypothetical protein
LKAKQRRFLTLRNIALLRSPNAGCREADQAIRFAVITLSLPKPVVLDSIVEVAVLTFLHSIRRFPARFVMMPEKEKV